MNVGQVLDRQAARHPDKAAVIFRGEKISFRALREASFKLADSLAHRGIARGDRVAICLPGGPEYIYTYLACWSLGATVVPLDFMLTQDELLSCLSHSQAKMLIAVPRANISLEELKSKAASLDNIVTARRAVEGCLSFEELLEKGKLEFPRAAIQATDYAIIFYTSGTTGKPKGVLINYLQLGAPPKSMEFFVNFNDNDVTLCALPFSHLGGLIYIQNCISYGLTIVLMERFIPVEFLKSIHNYKVTCFWIVPSMYYAFLQLKEFESFDLSSLRWIVTFGASSSPDALRRFHQFCPKARLLNGWGMTETNAPTTVLPMDSDKIESVGRPAPWIEVKIFDEHDKELPAGKTGEVVVKSWVVTDGYYKDPGLTKEAKRFGWFHTGDLGEFDEDGLLYIVGRKKEMIKVGGEIVFEPEVESVIQKHPDVAEVAVIGVFDNLRGEAPKAFVVLKKGRNLSEEDLRYFLRERLAHFKIPHYFEFREALPKNRTGKINKESLRNV